MLDVILVDWGIWSELLYRRHVLETKKRLLKFFILSNLLYGSDSEINYSQMKWKPKTTHMWFYWRMSLHWKDWWYVIQYLIPYVTVTTSNTRHRLRVKADVVLPTNVLMKKLLLNYYVVTNLYYGTKGCTISLQIKNSLKATDMSFLRRMP